MLLNEEILYYAVAGGCILGGSGGGDKPSGLRAGHVALNLPDSGTDFILLDCIGYNEKHLKLLKGIVNIPVIVLNQLMSKLASEFI